MSTNIIILLEEILKVLREQSKNFSEIDKFIIFTGTISFVVMGASAVLIFFLNYGIVIVPGITADNLMWVFCPFLALSIAFMLVLAGSEKKK